MIRIVVQTCDAGMAVHVQGGTVDTSVATFDIDAPELEQFLAEYENAKKSASAGLYWHRNIIGGHVVSENGRGGK